MLQTSQALRSATSAPQTHINQPRKLLRPEEALLQNRIEEPDRLRSRQQRQAVDHRITWWNESKPIHFATLNAIRSAQDVNAGEVGARVVGQDDSMRLTGESPAGMAHREDTADSHPRAKGVAQDPGERLIVKAMRSAAGRREHDGAADLLP